MTISTSKYLARLSSSNRPHLCSTQASTEAIRFWHRGCRWMCGRDPRGGGPDPALDLGAKMMQPRGVVGDFSWYTNNLFRNRGLPEPAPSLFFHVDELPTRCTLPRGVDGQPKHPRDIRSDHSSGFKTIALQTKDYFHGANAACARRDITAVTREFWLRCWRGAPGEGMCTSLNSMRTLPRFFKSPTATEQRQR